MYFCHFGYGYEMFFALLIPQICVIPISIVKRLQSFIPEEWSVKL